MWVLGFVFFFELSDINTFAYAAPAILKLWRLSISEIGWITSATFVGMFIGAMGAGWLSDRIGRKKALVLTTVWYSSFSLLNACAWGPAGLIATRLPTGMGVAAMTVVGITYVSEMFPARLRGSYQSWTLMIGLFGISATAYVARFVVPIAPWGWRIIFVWGGLAIFFPLFAGLLEESPRWYEKQGRNAEAEAVLGRIEAWACQIGPLPAPQQSVEAEPRRRYIELFRGSSAPRTALLVFVWISQTLGLYGFTAWVPTLLVAQGFSLVRSLAWTSTMSLGAVPGALIGALISDRWQRKWSISVVAVVIAFCGLMYGLTFHVATIVIFGFLVALLVQTFAPLLYAYTAECYPTEIRNSGTGLTYGIGRLANAFGPLIIASLYTREGYRSVFVYIAICWLAAAIAVAGFGPQTKGKTLS